METSPIHPERKLFLPKSRYETEFEEIGFIGAGGFGSVAKCRLRRQHPLAEEDESDLYFAVKRISLPSSNDPESDAFVLREASSLASLHHEYIVRYFSAWLEEGRPRSQHVPKIAVETPSSRRVPPPLVPKTATPFYFSTRGGLSSARLQDNQYASSTPSSDSSSGSIIHAQPALAAFLRRELLSPSCSEGLEESSSSSSSSAASSSDSASGSSSVGEGSVSVDQPHDPATANDAPSPSRRSSSHRVTPDLHQPCRAPSQPSSLSESSQEVMFLRASGDQRGSSGGLLTPLSKAPDTLAGVTPLKDAPSALPPPKVVALPRYLYIAMEFVDGMTLRQAIHHSSFHGDIWMVWESFRQICEGVAFIHDHHYVHRDLKPENVFLKLHRDGERTKVDNGDGSAAPKTPSREHPRKLPWTVKIGDFGLSTFVEKPLLPPRLSMCSQPRMSTAKTDPVAVQTVGVGTQFYIAPEVERSQGGYDQAADLFALGVILFEMLVPPPKTVMERHVTLSRLIASQGKNAAEEGVSDKTAAGLITSLLSREASERPSAPQLLLSIPVQTVSKAGKTLTNLMAHPYSHEMLRLLNSLFVRTETESRCRRFWEKYTLPPLASSAVVTELKSFINSVFRTFNAIQVDLPVVLPPSARSLPHTSEPYQLLTPTGEILELPHCLLQSMQATLPAVQVASVIRRFAVEPVYRLQSRKLLQPFDAQRAQPSSSLRVVFDNVVNFSKLDVMERSREYHTQDRIQRETLFEIEPIRVLWTVVNAFTPWLGESELVYTFGAVVPLLLKVFMKLPSEAGDQLGAYVRAVTYNAQKFKQRLREVFATEIATGKMSSDFTEFAKQVGEWRSFRGEASEWVAQQRRKTVLLSAEDPNVAALNDILSHIVCFEETLSVALGGLTMRRVRFAVTLDYDTTLFNSDTGFVFLHYITPPAKSRRGHISSQPLRGSNSFNRSFALPQQSDIGYARFDRMRLKEDAPAIAIGGRYDVHNEDPSCQPSPPPIDLSTRSLNAFGVEIDIQRLVDATMTSPTTAASHPKWKTRWRNHFIQQSHSRRGSLRSGGSHQLIPPSDVEEESPLTPLDLGGSKLRSRSSRAGSRNGERAEKRKGTAKEKDRAEEHRKGSKEKDREESKKGLNLKEDTKKGGEDSGAGLVSHQGLTKSSSLAVPNASEPTTLEPSTSKLNNAFLLLPPCTPIDTVAWLQALNELHPTQSGVVTTEIAKSKSNWRVAVETSYAPSILRRFNPMIMAGHATDHPSSHMVQIVYQSARQITQALVLRARLSKLHITSFVRSDAIADLGSAKRHTRQGTPFDWLLFVSARSVANKERASQESLRTVSDVSQTTQPVPASAVFDKALDDSGFRYRLIPCHASKYIGTDETRRHHIQSEIELADRWYESVRSLCASLMRFYLELLGAMSPSVGHLFTAQSDIALANAT